MSLVAKGTDWHMTDPAEFGKAYAAGVSAPRKRHLASLHGTRIRLQFYDARGIRRRLTQEPIH